MKKILVLGGAAGQVPLIRTAKEQGYYVVLCDYTTTNPGIPLVDKHYQVSTMDREAVLQVALQEKVDGVISNSEAVMTNVAYVAEKLGLVGNPESGISIIASKSKFRAFQKKLGLYAPDFLETGDLEVLKKTYPVIQKPMMIKPSESSGSRGTTLVDSNTSWEEIGKAFAECAGFSRNGLVTIEEYVSMPTPTVLDGDVFVMGDEIIWDGIFVSHRSPLAPMIPMTTEFPIQVSPEQTKILHDTFARIFREAGIVHGQYNIEMYFTEENQLFVLEINARQGGNKIPEQILEHCGVDMTRLLVSTAMGDNRYWEELKTFPRECRLTTKHILFSHRAGKYVGLDIAEEIRPYVHRILMYAQPGDPVPKAENASCRIGHVDLIFQDKQTQQRFCRNAEDYIRVLVEE